MKYSKEEILAGCAKMCKNTLMETLEIEFIDVGKDFLIAKMPVTPKVHQPALNFQNQRSSAQEH